MESNQIIDRLPPHLKELIIDQPYNDYTHQDHALWRYVMRQNLFHLPKIAYHNYIEGLKKTGISIDYIPQLYGMNRILKEIGWAAVAVDGFIPPSAFMEFQAYNVLVIAADIRPIAQIGYTPAPDIIHEAAGHAPIIADKNYADYLVRFGEVGSKAFRSQKDIKMYNAVRHLSILKADPYTKEDDIKKAEQELANLEKSDIEISELAQIRNLHWWTVEYGLIGELNNPKIYGAGLLSSISESYSCLQDDVKKLNYSIEAANISFDITSKQPQLFVTPNFNHLIKVLEEFSQGMAYNTGGLKAVHKAIQSGSTATCQLETGIQISGTFTKVIEQNGKPVFLKTSGPTSLNIDDKQIRYQGTYHHKEGYATIVGKISNIPEYDVLDEYAIKNLKNGSEKVLLIFDSGIELTGIPIEYYHSKGKLILISFDACTITYKNEILYEPSCGPFDLTIGKKVVSVYPRPADPSAFNWHYPQIQEKTHKIDHDTKAQRLHEHYGVVKAIREDCFLGGSIENIWKEIHTNYPDEWLIQLEILEILGRTKNQQLYNDVFKHLRKLKKRPELSKLIEDGLNIINN